MSIASISSSDALEPTNFFARTRLSDSDLDDTTINLTDDDSEDAKPCNTRRLLDQEAWDAAITKAVDNADGIIALV